MRLHSVSIAGVRTDIPGSTLWKQTVAEIETTSELEAGDFVNGRFLDLSAAQLFDLHRMKNLRLHIGENSYKLLSVDDTGRFIAVKEREA